MTEKYRIETGKLYEYDKAHNAYIFVMSLYPGETKAEAIARYEEWELNHD